MIEIDGSYGEGGGQIVRTALALSVLTGESFSINKIRSGRSKSGLKAQHLQAIKILKKICNAKTNEIDIGSETLTFEPGKLKNQTLEVDVGTAGSIALLMQALWIPLICHGKKFKLIIKGGTDVSWSMQSDYLRGVFIPQLLRYAEVTYNINRRGYYPKGQGEVEVIIKGKSRFDVLSGKFYDKKNEEVTFSPINLIKKGRLVQIRGVSHASSDLSSAQVAERQASFAKSMLTNHDTPVNIEIQYADTASTGSGITLWAVYSLFDDEVDMENPSILGSDILGARGKKSEEVAAECVKNLKYLIEQDAPVDYHLADNLVPLIGVFGGQFKTTKITKHTLTNIYTVNKFLGNVVGVNRENNMVRRV